MIKPIEPGTQNFEEYINKGLFYIDKTSFIKTVIKPGPGKVILITRPRRFGKTLTMSTFYEFLRINPKDPNNLDDISYQEALFKDTKIYEDKEFCQKYMGKFPVVFITFKDVIGPTFNDAFSQIGMEIYKLVNKTFSYLFVSDKLNEEDKNILSKMKNIDIYDLENGLFTTTSRFNILRYSLKFLSEYLNAHHGIKPIILIDEYDVPLSKGRTHGYYNEIKEVMSGLLGSSLKDTNELFTKAVLTGCLRAAKESIFTGLNNFSLNTVQSDDLEFSKGIGFTEDEVNQVLDYYNLSDYKDMVKENYNGYYFGDVTMYCPWDVMFFCNDNYKKILNKTNQKIVSNNYWINSSGNAIINEFMGFISPNEIDKMQDLLDGKSIITTIQDCLCYGDLDNHNEEDFWTLLLYTGYLTINPNYRSNNDDEYEVRIPNLEIRKCFKERIYSYLTTNPDMKNYTCNFVKGLFTGDAISVENNLTLLLNKYVSLRDFATKSPPENYYQVFLNGLLATNSTILKQHASNLESGNGYVDIYLQSLDGKSAVIIELKQTKNHNASKELICQDALKQIKDEHYADEYINNLDYKSVYIYGICFHRKLCSVLVEKLK